MLIVMVKTKMKKILSDSHETFGIYVKSYSKTKLFTTFFYLDRRKNVLFKIKGDAAKLLNF